MKNSNRNIPFNNRRARAITGTIFFALILGLLIFCMENIFQSLIERKIPPIGFIVSLFPLFAIIFFMSWKLRSGRILGVSVEMSSEKNEPSRKFLLTGYSPPHPDEVIALERAEKNVKFAGDKKSFATLILDTEIYRSDEKRPNIGGWQQNIRAIAPHIETLKSIYILRPNERDEEFELFKTFIELCLKSIGKDEIEIRAVHHLNRPNEPFQILGASTRNTPPDYEDYRYVYEGLRTAIKIIEKKEGKKNVKPEDFIIDITPGFKIFSIAAADLTLNENMKFSYVNNKGYVTFYDTAIRLASG